MMSLGPEYGAIGTCSSSYESICAQNNTNLFDLTTCALQQVISYPG